MYATNEQIKTLAKLLEDGRYVKKSIDTEEGFQLTGLNPLLGIVPERVSVDKAYITRMLPSTYSLKNLNYIDNDGAVATIVDTQGSEYYLNIFTSNISQDNLEYVRGDVVLMKGEM